MIEVPKVDERTGADVAREIYARLHLSRLREDQLKQRIDAALVNVFGRFSEMVIDRLNKAPEKKFLAFLDFLGVSPLPPEAAVVPLTFFMTPKASSHTVVPAGTRVSASPAKGNQKPVMFETLSELVVTATELDSLFVKNGRGAYSDLAPALAAVSGSHQQGAFTVPERAVDGTSRPIPHIFYISIPSNPAWQSIERLRLQFVVDNAQTSSPGERAIQWEIGRGAISLDAEPGRPLEIVVPETDTTESLTKTGTVDFKSLPAIPVSVVNGIPSYWLCCRLLAPLIAEVEAGADIPKAPPAARIKEVTAAAEHARMGLPAGQAFYEKLALDVTKDFFPFGQRPRLGDALYLGCREAFSERGTTVTIHIELANPDTPDPGSGIPRLKSNHPELRWEFWDGQAWTALDGKSLGSGAEGTGAESDDAITTFYDGTLSLSRSGIVRFSFPGEPAELNLNGIKSHWVRVRISAGDYGREVQVQRDEATGALSTIPATLAPPSIRSLKIDYSARKESKPSVVLLDEWEVTRVAPASPFRPFAPSTPENAVPSLYVGFRNASSEPPTTNHEVTVPLGKGAGLFPRLPVSAYVLIDELAVRTSTGSDQVAAMWEYWNGIGWKRFTVADETQGLRKSGLVQFLPPGDFVDSHEFGKRRYWLRMRLSEDEVPPVRAILLNTTMAAQGLTITDDILGSSSGEPNQRFRTTYPSVLAGQKLEVCEPTIPSLSERGQLRRYAGIDVPIQPATDKTGKTVYWATWREVDSFHASGARDRHYILDHVAGEVLFGDGVGGMIPPILAGNVRMKCYRTGGGSIGNQPAQAVKQLVSAVPYVQKVVNWVPATGGSDSEPIDAFVERGPREMRHRGRAVTTEDFEDLALRSSREVARARCVPQCNLKNDPNATYRRPGLVSVIVVPRSSDAKPVPSMDLLERVKGFLDARRLATAELVVVCPEYVRVDVEAEIVVNRPQDANQVEQTIAAALNHYLHPIWGGPAGSGWDFGRLPRRSDLYVLIERIPGVSHIGNLTLTMISDRPEAEKARHFLVYSGHNTLTMTL